MSKTKAAVGDEILFMCMGEQMRGKIVAVYRGKEPNDLWRQCMGAGVFYKCATP